MFLLLEVQGDSWISGFIGFIKCGKFLAISFQVGFSALPIPPTTTTTLTPLSWGLHLPMCTEHLVAYSSLNLGSLFSVFFCLCFIFYGYYVFKATYFSVQWLF